MTPRQQRLLDAVRECLARPAAWEGVRRECVLLAEGQIPARIGAAIAAYCGERARQLPGVIEEVLREEGEERDAVGVVDCGGAWAETHAPAEGATWLAGVQVECPSPEDAQRWRARLSAFVAGGEERDAAVRALISEANIPRGLLAAVGEDKYDFSREAAADVARRLGAVLLAVVKHYPPESE